MKEVYALDVKVENSKSGQVREICPQELEPKVLHSLIKPWREVFMISVTLDNFSCDLSRTKLANSLPKMLKPWS